MAIATLCHVSVATQIYNHPDSYAICPAVPVDDAVAGTVDVLIYSLKSENKKFFVSSEASESVPIILSASAGVDDAYVLIFAIATISLEVPLID